MRRALMNLCTSLKTINLFTSIFSFPWLPTLLNTFLRKCDENLQSMFSWEVFIWYLNSLHCHVAWGQFNSSVEVEFILPVLMFVQKPPPECCWVSGLFFLYSLLQFLVACMGAPVSFFFHAGAAIFRKFNEVKKESSTEKQVWGQ